MTTTTASSPQVGSPAPGSHDAAAKTPAALVLFGASGDLASRKLIPALFALWQGGFLPEPFLVLGVAIDPLSDDQFRELAREAVREHGRVQPSSDDAWRRFAMRLSYQQLDFGKQEEFHALAKRLGDLEAAMGLKGNRLFYLAVSPSFFAQVIEQLSAAGLVRREEQDPPDTRIIIEKPFGDDLRSAIALNQTIHRFLSESQIYRIDHYLGKDAVQNIFAFRFANSIFEPLLSNLYVDHVQITVAETVGMEGKRGGFYDRTGALRDVLQNHMLQLLAYAAIDAPGGLKPENIRSEKLRILRNLVPIAGDDVARRAVRAQYRAGKVDGQTVKAYREEIGVKPDSTTETFVAVRTSIDTWRWAGVPFLLRTGKRLPTRATEIAVRFKPKPLSVPQNIEDLDGCAIGHVPANVLAFRIQPDEGISISFLTKRPGFGYRLRPVQLDFDFERAFRIGMPEAYEHLLLDALKGYSLFFMPADEVEAQWAFVTPILEAWHEAASSRSPDPGLACAFYDAGTWGPSEADRLLDGCRGGWRRPGETPLADECEDLHRAAAAAGAPAPTPAPAPARATVLRSEA